MGGEGQICDHKIGMQALHVAAQFGHLAIVELLAARGAEASSATSGAGARPLHFAAVEDYVTVAEHLTARGAEASTADVHGQRPFHLASQKGHRAVVSFLDGLSRGVLGSQAETAKSKQKYPLA